MNLTEEFLIKSGIHNFVTCQASGQAPVFSIKSTTHHKMVRHAQKLIKSAFGESIDIRLE